MKPEGFEDECTKNTVCGESAKLVGYSYLKWEVDSKSRI